MIFVLIKIYLALILSSGCCLYDLWLGQVFLLAVGANISLNVFCCCKINPLSLVGHLLCKANFSIIFKIEVVAYADRELHKTVPCY